MSELPPSGTDITVIQDEQGILFLGDDAELEPWLTEQGLVSREWRSRATHTAFVTGTGLSAIGNLAGRQHHSIGDRANRSDRLRAAVRDARDDFSVLFQRIV